MEQAQNMISNVGEMATNVRGQLGQVLAERGTTIVAVLLIVGLACLLIAYVLYKIITYVVVSRSTHTIPGTDVPVPGNKYSKLNGSGIPNAGNGKRMSMSFWIYINDIDKYSGTARHVFHRGTDVLTIDSGPVVVLDAQTNKLHIILDMNLNNAYKMLPTNTDPTTGALRIHKRTPSGLNADGSIKTASPLTGDDIRFLAAAQGITIDYIPLQRWVHVAVVANEDFSGGQINAYVDGELVKSVMNSDTQSPFHEDKTFKVATGITNIALDHRGDIWVGGDFTSAVGPGFSGLVSNVRFFNYDLNVKDVYGIYMEGPINNLMARLGLPAYGVRSPIYRLS